MDGGNTERRQIKPEDITPEQWARIMTEANRPIRDILGDAIVVYSSQRDIAPGTAPILIRHLDPSEPNNSAQTKKNNTHRSDLPFPLDY